MICQRNRDMLAQGLNPLPQKPRNPRRSPLKMSTGAPPRQSGYSPGTCLRTTSGGSSRSWSPARCSGLHPHNPRTTQWQTNEMPAILKKTEKEKKKKSIREVATCILGALTPTKPPSGEGCPTRDLKVILLRDHFIPEVGVGKEEKLDPAAVIH